VKDVWGRGENGQVLANPIPNLVSYQGAWRGGEGGGRKISLGEARRVCSNQSMFPLWEVGRGGSRQSRFFAETVLNREGKGRNKPWVQTLLKCITFHGGVRGGGSYFLYGWSLRGCASLGKLAEERNGEKGGGQGGFYKWG